MVIIEEDNTTKVLQLNISFLPLKTRVTLSVISDLKLTGVSSMSPGRYRAVVSPPSVPLMEFTHPSSNVLLSQP